MSSVHIKECACCSWRLRSSVNVNQVNWLTVSFTSIDDTILIFLWLYWFSPLVYLFCRLLRKWHWNLWLLWWVSLILPASRVVLVVRNAPANAGDVREAGCIPGSGRSLGGGHGNPLQYSCLEKAMDRGAWCVTVYRVSKSRTRPKWLSTDKCNPSCSSIRLCFLYFEVLFLAA